jgi:long-chain-fatty-acid--[acyl-carrier-protein] ligase
MMAGKVPVMLNWTLGARHLDRVIEMSQVNVILSSWKFLERLGENIEFSKSMEDRLMMLEDIRRSFPLRTKLKALFRAKRTVKALLSIFHLKNLNEEGVAVILFTSGSEALPKGVPLTHKNLLSNLRSVKEVLPLDPQDVILGFLPPFHSFGFTAASLWPLLGGLKVAHSPNPTDGLQLAHDIQCWNATIVPGAPTFLKEILRAATSQELKSVRLFISGAEKMPRDLQEFIRKLGPDKQLIEGYGITECAPNLTLTSLDRPSKGVGHPVPGVELCIVNPETFEILPQGREGLILASGPNIFKGYLEASTTSPFLEIEGKQWYRTGDLGHLDSDGYLILSGRMKRFVKIGGEMISLVAVEEAFEEALQKEGRKKDEDKPSVAVWAREKEGQKVHLILVTTLEMTLQEVNQMLKNSGFGSLVKISHAQQLPEIPLLATGKIDYRLLEEQLSI